MTDHSTCNDLMPGTGSALVKAVHCARPDRHDGHHENGLYRWPLAPAERHRRPILVGPVEPIADWAVPTWR